MRFASYESVPVASGADEDVADPHAVRACALQRALVEDVAHGVRALVVQVDLALQVLARRRRTTGRTAPRRRRRPRVRPSGCTRTRPPPKLTTTCVSVASRPTRAWCDARCTASSSQSLHAHDGEVRRRRGRRSRRSAPAARCPSWRRTTVARECGSRLDDDVRVARRPPRAGEADDDGLGRARSLARDADERVRRRSCATRCGRQVLGAEDLAAGCRRRPRDEPARRMPARSPSTVERHRAVAALVHEQRSELRERGVLPVHLTARGGAEVGGVEGRAVAPSASARGTNRRDRHRVDVALRRVLRGPRSRCRVISRQILPSASR